MYKVQLAFYKGEGNIVDKAIRLWTRSKYSHVELVIGEYWYSTSPRLKKLTKRVVYPNPDHWDYISVELSIDEVEKLYNRTKDAKYDWFGIVFSQFFPFKLHTNKRWFCSEWAASAMGLEETLISPGELYDIVRRVDV